MDGYSTAKSVSCFWYSAETDIWWHINKYEEDWDGIYGFSYLEQPNWAAEEANSWILVSEDNKASSDLIAISTKEGVAYDLESKWTYAMDGMYGDGVCVLVATDYSDNASGLVFLIPTRDKLYRSITNMQILLMILNLCMPMSDAVHVWPAFNMPGALTNNATETSSS